MRVNETTWTVKYMEETGVYQIFKEEACFCNHLRNAHCIACGVCAYSWICTYQDNRTGISCNHRHAVNMLTAESSLTERLGSRPDKVGFVKAIANYEGNVVEAAQERREARYQKLESVKDYYAVIEAAASSIAKEDNENVNECLGSMLSYMRLATNAISCQYSYGVSTGNKEGPR